ncbi:hypothetical protein [Polaromonas jejuensis]|uniref:hypothetical protein n=1 Tax=Polaromonas jejuensis TaxID=457502 RepID=UPI0012ED760A|nr:hypothetical protein [Polaromonas jejuensis]
MSASSYHFYSLQNPMGQHRRVIDRQWNCTQAPRQKALIEARIAFENWLVKQA